MSCEEFTRLSFAIHDAINTWVAKHGTVEELKEREKNFRRWMREENMQDSPEYSDGPFKIVSGQDYYLGLIEVSDAVDEAMQRLVDASPTTNGNHTTTTESTANNSMPTKELLNDYKEWFRAIHSHFKLLDRHLREVQEIEVANGLPTR